MRRREVVVRVPGSKSVAIRALVIGALAHGTTVVEGAPRSDDLLGTVEALDGLGVRVRGRSRWVRRGGDLHVEGRGGRYPGAGRILHLHGSATGLRLMAAVAALGEEYVALTGDRSLRRRPLGGLGEALRALGAEVLLWRGGLPMLVRGPLRAPAGGVAVDAGGTSQVASALLCVGPLLPGGLSLRLRGSVVSAPYIDLTADLLRRFGATVVRRGPGFRVVPGALRGRRIVVEPDWSSAAYPLAAAAILGRRVRVPSLSARSLQADRAVLGLLRRAGARCGVDARGAWCEGKGRLRPFDADLRDAPDLAPAAAALALFAPGKSRVRGAAHLRAKESDRIASCVAAVRALGGRAEERRDGFVVRGGAPRAGVVDPRGDHRIALAFAVAAAAIPGARVRDAACVAKSWPGALEAMRPLLETVSLSPREARG